MKSEFSAGGIIFKKIKDKQSFSANKKLKIKNRIFIVVSQHSMHHGWVFPKGLIGDNIKGEKKEDTAIREVKEEVGVDTEIVKELEPVSFWYVFKGQKIKKTVYYFIMRYIGGNFENRDHEMENVEWVELDRVFEKLTYKSDKEVFKQAKSIIEKL